MNGSARVTRATIVAFSAIVEAGTGLGLAFAPALVLQLLLGGEHAGSSLDIARVSGIALLSLAIACWPGRDRAAATSAAGRAFLTYNALVALYLGFLGATSQASGMLLWPAVVLHAVVAVLLVWKVRGP